MKYVQMTEMQGTHRPSGQFLYQIVSENTKLPMALLNYRLVLIIMLKSYCLTRGRRPKFPCSDSTFFLCPTRWSISLPCSEGFEAQTKVFIAIIVVYMPPKIHKGISGITTYVIILQFVFVYLLSEQIGLVAFVVWYFCTGKVLNILDDNITRSSLISHTEAENSSCSQMFKICHQSSGFITSFRSGMND